MTDPRRKFTNRQARYLAERAGGRCERCGNPLPDGWHAHHVVGHAAGGPTAVWNGRALCPRCHQEQHSMPEFKPRRWQQECFREFEVTALERGKKLFVLEACPGAGKTSMAAWMARTLLRDDRFIDAFNINHVIAVVPSLSIQGEADPKDQGKPSGMCSEFMDQGLRVRNFLLESHARVSQAVPSGFDASVITYQAISPDVFKTINLWRRENGDWRFALVLDEVHHTRLTGGEWGSAAEQLSSEAAFTICMSGTYFRSDGHPITLIPYAGDRPDANYRYTYRQGLLDRCVRPVAFHRHDVTFDIRDNDTGEDVFKGVTLGRVETREQIAAAQRSVFDHQKCTCLPNMIREAHADLVRKRGEFPDAGCLLVCRPGTGGRDAEDRHVHQVEGLVHAITGTRPVVLTHHDGDEITRDKLKAFREGTDPYLVAVNMVSEGCNIPRLRSLVFCRYTESEMLFRQVVGRVMRAVGCDDHTAADVYLPRFPLMDDFATNLMNECLEARKVLECPKCSAYPCACPCPACGWPKPECTCQEGPGGGDGPRPAPRLDAVNIVSARDGGLFGNEAVAESYVQVAEELVTTQASYTYQNTVVLGHAMQFFAARCGAAPPPAAPPPAPSLSQQNIAARINKTVRQLAALLHPDQEPSERIPHAWRTLFFDAYKVGSFAEAKAQWSAERLERVCGELEQRERTLRRRQ